MINTSIEEFNRWLKKPEDVHVEFKEAKAKFNYDHKLVDYCSALANEGGGKLILGVDNSGNIVGSKAFQGTHTMLSNQLLDEIGLRVDIEELQHPQGRVLIFHVPAHYIGKPIKSNHTYWMRSGSSLTAMDEQTLKRKLNEGEPDFSSTIIPCLTLDGLDSSAIDKLRKKWAKESGRLEFLEYNDEKLLRNLGIITDKGITCAALILVGKNETLAECLPDAEIIYEYRHDPKQTNYDFRKSWRGAFIDVDDDIWEVINARNIRIPFQEGFLQREVWGYDEKSIREAVHNAVMHRDYSIKGKSIFIKASPEEFNIESPGGLFPPVTLNNILIEKAWRNRLLAEAFEKVGFAERSSQGMDDIFDKTIRDGKGMPDLSKTDSNAVRLSIPAQVKDKDFILYLERIINKYQAGLSFEEIYELEKIRKHQKVDRPDFKDKFLNLGIIEPVGKGRGTKYILSRQYYEIIGQSGKHTRISGISRDQMKELILNHIRQGKPSRREDFISGFSEYSPKDISNLLQELKRDNKIKHEGSKRKGIWRIKS